MTSLVDQVRLAFDLAALRQEAGRNLSADDWRQYQTINETHDERRRAVEQIFAQTYDERVAVVRQRLIEEAGLKRLDYVPRLVGRDRFDGEVIERQARLQVSHDYRSSIERIDRDEARQIEALLARADQRNRAREVPLRDFTRAADRRGGPDRRKRHH